MKLGKTDTALVPLFLDVFAETWTISAYKGDSFCDDVQYKPTCNRNKERREKKVEEKALRWNDTCSLE